MQHMGLHLLACRNPHVGETLSLPACQLSYQSTEFLSSLPLGLPTCWEGIHSLKTLHRGAAHTRTLFSLLQFRSNTATDACLQRAFEDSLPNRGSYQRGWGWAKRKKKRGCVCVCVCESPTLSSSKAVAESSKGCCRPCQKGREWALLLCQRGSLCRAQLIRKNQTEVSGSVLCHTCVGLHCRGWECVAT